jgi:hypothetical protein
MHTFNRTKKKQRQAIPEKNHIAPDDNIVKSVIKTKTPDLAVRRLGKKESSNEA